MIRREESIAQAFDRWDANLLSPRYTAEADFSLRIFDAIDIANLEQMELLRKAFPEHVKLFEEKINGAHA